MQSVSKRGRWIFTGLGVIAAALALLAAYRYLGWAAPNAIAAELARDAMHVPADLAQPDAVIRSTSLARLPRDLLRLPLARDVLTEDIVFYYEQHEDRLALRGALRRIAYEHRLEWSDRVIEAALDAPAEIGLWRDGKGALRRFAVVLERNMFAKLLEEAAAVAMKDRQLRLAGEMSVGGHATPIFALTLSPRRTLLVVAGGERIAVLSDAGLLFDQKGNVIAAAQRAVSDWLAQAGALGGSFQLDAAGRAPAHSLALGARTLTLGYAPLVPALKALRFDFSADEGWSTHIWLAPNMPGAKSDAEIWSAVPANPAACLVLPLDWKSVVGIAGAALKQPGNGEAAQLATLQGSALACWYGESSLYAPLFAVRLVDPPKDRDALLRTLAAWALRPVPTAGDRGQGDTNEGKNDPQPTQGLPRAMRALEAGTLRWQPQGAAEGATVVPTVAARGEYVFFSPDPTLVDLALDTLARRNPSVADQMSNAAGTLALLTPRTLAPMFEREALAALARQGDASLRAVAQERLAPRMRALGGYPSYRLVLGGAAPAETWRRVEWRIGARP